MYTASPANSRKKRGMSTLLARSMPPAMPRAMMTSVTAMAAVCQRVLPQAEAVALKKAVKPSTPSCASTAPVKLPAAYFKSQPTTTE